MKVQNQAMTDDRYVDMFIAGQFLFAHLIDRTGVSATRVRGGEEPQRIRVRMTAALMHAPPGMHARSRRRDGFCIPELCDSDDTVHDTIDRCHEYRLTCLNTNTVFCMAEQSF